jgi:gliding motility-associated protein GldE
LESESALGIWGVAPFFCLLWTFPTGIVLGVLAIALLLLCSALISGSEIAYFSLDHNDLERLDQESGVVSRRVLFLRNRQQELLATILIGNNLVNVAIVLISELVLRQIFSEALFLRWGESLLAIPFLASLGAELLSRVISFTITIVGVTFLLVLFGEVAPKVYAQFNGVRLARLMSSPLFILRQVFHPLVRALVNGTGFLERKLAERPGPGGTTSREDIDEAIELTVNGRIDVSEQDIDILKRIVKFSDVTVRQIMRARVDMVAADLTTDYHTILQLIRDSGYSRVPIYEEDSDNVRGILYVKDLIGHLNEPADFNWKELVRTDTMFIPENKKISDLLRDFQQEKIHMAIVVDEYGGTAGLVTLEDVLEEVIGDIQDEFDAELEVIYQKVDDLNFIFDGKTMLNDVCRIIGVSTDTFDAVRGEADSFAGLILEMLSTMPEQEQEIAFGNFRFKIVSVTERRIEEILITLPEPVEEV